ncbi:MAG: hypothetical protein WEK74_00195 [Hydrogenophaga sp.]
MALASVQIGCVFGEFAAIGEVALGFLDVAQAQVPVFHAVFGACDGAYGAEESDGKNHAGHLTLGALSRFATSGHWPLIHSTELLVEPVLGLIARAKPFLFLPESHVQFSRQHW